MPLLPPAPDFRGRSTMHNDSLTADHLRSIPSLLPTRPSAILVISAHWEVGADEADTPIVSVTAGETPSLLFDYSGFPPETYHYKYPAPGSPELAKRIQHLLESNEILSPLVNKPVKVVLDHERGFDHGVFVPLLLAFPSADIPVVCLSLHRSLNPELHFSIGAKLAPLRQEGILIIGSGVSFHNMRVLMQNWGATRAVLPEQAAGADFDKALRNAVLLDVNGDEKREDTVEIEASAALELTRTLEASNSTRRFRALMRWKSFPGATTAHPREEHLIPLLVAAGAGGNDEAAVIFEDVCMGAVMTGFRFG